MKKYGIRPVGWVFDDDWYNYDGEYEIEELFSTREEAEKRIDEHNQKILLSGWVFTSRSFQLTYSQAEPDIVFVGKSELGKKLAEILDIEVERVYNPKSGFTREMTDTYVKQLSPKQITSALTELGLSFYKLVSFESETQAFYYHFRRNKNLWLKHFDETYHFTEDDYLSFKDDSPMEGNRIALTKKECYYFAVNDPYDPISRQLATFDLLTGSLEELSDTPDLLKSVISNAEHIHYNADKKLIEFDYKVSHESLMALDQVLKEPLIILEKIKLE